MRRGFVFFQSVVVLLVLLVWAGTAWSADFEEYSNLSDRANAAHDLLVDAPEDRLEILRETAADADLLVIQWLDEFMVDPDWDALPAEQQAIVFQNRYRWEYNYSSLLIHLDRCEDAQTRIRALLDSAVNDAELRPRLTGAFENAVACVNRDRSAVLSVSAVPADAEVYVDGVLVGLATGDLPIELGEHQVTIRSAGFIAQEVTVEANEERETVSVSVTLEEEPDLVLEDPGVQWQHVMLWTIGAVGIGTSVAYFLIAADRQDQIDDPPDGQRVEDLEEEEDIIADLQVLAIVSGSVGLVSAITGTVLFAGQSGGTAEEPEDEVVGTLHIGLGSVIFNMTF